MASRRSLSKVAVALDIDGVLLRGRTVLPGATEAVSRLQQARVPHVFLTNGGGVLEAAKAAELTDLLRVDVDENNVLLAHTPMKSLASDLGLKRCMVLGCKNELAVARSYGFQKVVSPQQFVAQHPAMYPFREVDREPDPHEGEPIEAVLVFHDPVDIHLELQVVVDVLLGQDPLSSVLPGSSARQRVPLFNSNDDFVFAGKYQWPRFAQGMFVQTLEMLYARTCGSTLEISRYGKPHIGTYKFAEQRLRSLGGNEEVEFDHIYAIGDNPRADIRGANTAGWRSVLVRTGVWDGETNDTKDPAHFVCDSVSEALNVALGTAQ